MKNLNNYINEQLLWGGFYGRQVTFPLSQKSVDLIASTLDRDLSPENLHCDGEISPAQAERKYQFYGKVIKELEDYCLYNVLGMPVVEEYY
ncbi:MAG: hypothetical protein HOJ68_12785 [Bacteroidetes bacterium]|nr:hypothetical protein [Bacteroidota bacterium]